MAKDDIMRGIQRKTTHLDGAQDLRAAPREASVSTRHSSAEDGIALTDLPPARHSSQTTIAEGTKRKSRMKNAAKQQVFGRGRPSIERAVAIDSAILAAAAELFLRDGFDLVTMEAVALATPLSKTTLYSRFASKEVLLAAVVHDQIEQWSANATQEYPHLPEDIGERLRIHACVMAKAMRQRLVMGFTKLSFVLTERYPAMSRQMYDEGVLRQVHFIRDEIEAASKRDNRPTRDAVGVARHFVNSVAGWSIQEAARNPTEAEALAAAVRTAELVVAARDHW